MNKKSEKVIEKIFQKIFKKRGNFKNFKRINEEKWDSLAHVNLIVALESELKIRFKPNEIEICAISIKNGKIPSFTTSPETCAIPNGPLKFEISTFPINPKYV